MQSDKKKKRKRVSKDTCEPKSKNKQVKKIALKFVLISDSWLFFRFNFGSVEVLFKFDVWS